MYAVIETCLGSEFYSIIYLVILSQLASLNTEDTKTETCSVDVAL
jgi:hypothetical protein